MMQSQRQCGFTLIETLIVLAISTIMLIALCVLIYTFNTASSYEQTSIQSSSSASAVIREIQALTLPASGVLQTHTFSGTAYTSTSTSLVLEIPSIDNSGNTIANTYDYAAFYVTGTNAYRLLQANASSARISGTKKLSSYIQSLTFTYNSSDFTQTSIVTADVQTRAMVKQNIISSRQREQVRLRNH